MNVILPKLLNRNTSNPNISDQERRANAEKAILMLAKFMNLDDDEFDNEETDD